MEQLGITFKDLDELELVSPTDQAPVRRTTGERFVQLAFIIGDGNQDVLFDERDLRAG